MPKKPLLTDDIVKEARLKRERLEENLRYDMEKDTELARKYDEEQRRLQKKSIYKSRRIENAKTQKRGKSLLKYLFILWAVLIAMIAWIIFSPWS
ncbi:cell wall synthase accessory phosphoprotein MacP [Lactovum miscens]|uniref:Fe2+ transport system protein B n=1 Tax=Lactovum miscens TaxID=190387 RepID=A0A841CBI7_9LACT|nr:cell wall synthase accessory phosphoprotein MacP [Lactovum miscens]MBB5888540.1 Fe2+ transport system protein B [Lactovum miscens]